MSMHTSANVIAGGIEVSGSAIIKSGGRDRVVGENAKWGMRNKFLQLKHLSTSKIADEKSLLKIVGLKIPLTFDKKLTFYDDDKKPIPVKSEENSNIEIHDKALIVLKQRLDESVDGLVKLLTVEYNLRAPLFWVLGDIVKLLAVVNKKQHPDSKKIKISPEMALMIEKIWDGKSYFQYVINSDEVPANITDLMLYMLDCIENNYQLKGDWVEPILDKVRYPCWCSISKNDVELDIENEKKELDSRVKNQTGLNVIKEYIFSILTVENMIIDHIDGIEKYFIHLAKNMQIICEGLKKFFKSGSKNGGAEEHVRILPLESATVNHIDRLSRIASNPEIYTALGDGQSWKNKIYTLHKQSKTDAKHRRRDYYHWVVLLGSTTVGYVGLRPAPIECGRGTQLRYFIDPQHQKKGIATTAIKSVLKAYRAIYNHTVPPVWATVSPDNIASEKVIKKLGFVKNKIIKLNGVKLNTYKYNFFGKKQQGDLQVNVSDHIADASKDFPFRYTFSRPFADMAKQLKDTANDFPPEWSVHQGGDRIGLVTRSFPEEYDNADSITDWEAEPVRIRCRERSGISPLEAWSQIRKSIGEMDVYDKREQIYKLSRGCNLFNIAFGIYLLKVPGLIGDIGDVLDPTSGWGDRLGAAYIAGAKSYRGYDTNILLQPVYNALAKRYEDTGLTLDWNIDSTPFEKVPDSDIEKKFDTVMTSPPYYTIELYEGSDTSTTVHPSMDEWYEGFYNVLWAKAAKAVRPGGRVIAHIPPGRMVEETSSILLKAGFEYIGAVGFLQSSKGMKQSTVRDAFIWRLPLI